MIFPASCYQPGVKWDADWSALNSAQEVRSRPLRRIFHHYLKWEEVKAGMWRDITAEERRAILTRAIEFTGNAILYGSFMLRVIVEWPISAEQNLSDVMQNRKAWVGHAAACLAIQSPEYVTREAWGYLSQKQQDDANDQAENAIQVWRKDFRK